MKKALPFILGIFISLHGFAQQKTIQGLVTDKQTGEPMPFTNLFVKGAYTGTTCNAEGRFSITIPGAYKNGILCFSFIGYKTLELPILSIQSPLNVKLESDQVLLQEVVVYPDSTLPRMLKKAHEGIPDNYLPMPSRQKIYFRDIIKSTGGTYMHFGEAILDVYKPPYKNKSDGQVKIENSQINKFPLSDTTIRTVFYGTTFMPLFGDYVKRRVSFIDPLRFKDYSYTLEGQTTIDGNSAYIISFRPKKTDSKASFQGKFYLDSTSLAYLYFDVEYSPYGTRERNQELHWAKSLDSKIKIYYQKSNGYYFMKYILAKENFLDLTTNKQMISTKELVVNSIETENATPIPFEEQSHYTDVFWLKAQDYQESTWEGDPVLLQDSSLAEACKMEYSLQESKNIMDSLNMVTHTGKKNRIEKMFRAVKRVYCDFDFLTATPTMPTGYGLEYRPSQNHLFQKTGEVDKNPFVNFGMRVGYAINKRWDLSYYASGPFGDGLFQLQTIGGAYQACLINRGHQLVLHMGLNYYFLKSGYLISKFDNNNGSFSSGGKNIDAEKLSIFCGKKESGLSPEIMLKTRIKKAYYLYVSCGYLIPFSKESRLFTHEKSGFFGFRKLADIPLNETSVVYSENTGQTSETLFSPGRFLFKAGIRLKL